MESGTLPATGNRNTPASNAVAAIVVTFHPDADILVNLSALRPQVEHLIVVDNASPPGDLATLRLAASSLHFELVENATNLGVATALNLGIRHAYALGAAWIVLFDQDSRVTPGFTAAMLQAFESSPWGERLGLLVPRYADMRHGNILAPQWLDRAEGTLAVSMTSGSLFRTRTLQQHGLFLDGLFIDTVDHEHCLRLRRAGLVLAEYPAAVLLHSPAAPRQFRLGGKLLFEAAHYSPLRRFYQQRNRLWMVKLYWRDFPLDCLRFLIASAKDLMKILLMEGDKLRKLQAFFHGLVDGLLTPVPLHGDGAGSIRPI
jgi:rhamnosyltransferase